MTSPEIISAYRRLYRTALKAVRYSTPARHQIKTAMRTGFRHQAAEKFDPLRVENTLRFLEQARKRTGMEHKILKNILHVRYWQNVAKRDLRLTRFRDSQELLGAIRCNLGYVERELGSLPTVNHEKDVVESADTASIFREMQDGKTLEMFRVVILKPSQQKFEEFAIPGQDPGISSVFSPKNATTRTWPSVAEIFKHKQYTLPTGAKIKRGLKGEENK